MRPYEIENSVHMAQLIAAYEDAHNVPCEKRLTRWYGDYGIYEFISEIAEEKFKEVKSKALAALGITEAEYLNKEFRRTNLGFHEDVVSKMLNQGEYKQLTVLLVEPMKLPREVTIDGSLESMQKLVDGYIQAIYPFEEEVALVCNKECKLMGLPLNRSLMMDGEMVDILVGNFFIVGAPSESESFSSLSKEQIEKYKKIYYSPEAFIRTSNGIVSIPITPKPAIKREKTQEPQQPEHTAQKQRRSVKK